MSAVSIGSSIYLHGCRDDRIGKNCLGTITITTGSNRDRSATGENNLVLFTVATRLHPIIDDDTDNRIPESLENDSYLDVNIRNLIVIDDQMIEVGKDNRDREPVYKRIASSEPERYLHCAKSVPSRQRQPKHQLKQSLLGPFQESSG